jgi:hypothetical protein
MADKLKTSYELAMERMRGSADAGKAKPLTDAQKKKIAEARRVAAARQAELEIRFHDARKGFRDAAEQEKAEAEYQIDRRRVDEDLERAIAEIRRGSGDRP